MQPLIRSIQHNDELFVEVTSDGDGRKVLLNVREIGQVLPLQNVHIKTVTDKDGRNTTVSTDAPYEEVMRVIFGPRYSETLP